MRTREDYNKGIVKLLTEIRAKQGLSKTKMAEMLNIDRHTWMRWETGECAPTGSDLMMIFETFGGSVVPAVLDLLYPESDIPTPHAKESIDQARKRIAKYFLEEASEREIRTCAFLMDGPDRKNKLPQLEEFCAIDHLPVHYRYFVAEQIYIYYMMARKDRELIMTSEIMPDLDMFVTGLKSAQRAAFDRLNMK